MARKRREYEDDDGRTVADMSGVARQDFLGRQSSEREKQRPESADSAFFQSEEKSTILPEERRWFILGALKAALLIALAFIVGLGLVILLLLKLWGA